MRTCWIRSRSSRPQCRNSIKSTKQTWGHIIQPSFTSDEIRRLQSTHKATTGIESIAEKVTQKFLHHFCLATKVSQQLTKLRSMKPSFLIYCLFDTRCDQKIKHLMFFMWLDWRSRTHLPNLEKINSLINLGPEYQYQIIGNELMSRVLKRGCFIRHLTSIY